MSFKFDAFACFKQLRSTKLITKSKIYGKSLIYSGVVIIGY